MTNSESKFRLTTYKQGSFIIDHNFLLWANAFTLTTSTSIGIELWMCLQTKVKANWIKRRERQVFKNFANNLLPRYFKLKGLKCRPQINLQCRKETRKGQFYHWVIVKGNFCKSKRVWYLQKSKTAEM